MEVLVQPVENADRLFVEIRNLQEQVEDLEYKLDARGQGVRSMDEVQSQLNALQSQKYIALNILCIVYHLETINCVHPINLTRIDLPI